MTAADMATRSGCSRSSRSRSTDGTHMTIATDDAWRASTGEIRSADLYDGSAIDLRERSAGCDRPGFDDRDWRAARSSRSIRAHRASDRPARPGHGRRRPPITRSRDGGCCGSTPARTSPGACGSRCRVRRVDVTVRHAEVLEADGSLHTRSLRSARATDAYVLADDVGRCSSPPSPSTGSASRRSRRRRGPGCRVRRDQQRPSRAVSSNARTPRLHRCTRTSCGRSATTSSRCRRIARSATSDWAGPATPRRSRRPPRTLLDSRRSGRAGCATSRSSRTRARRLDGRAGRRLAGEPRYGRAAGPTPRPSCRGRCTSRTATMTILRRQTRSMRRWVDSLDARRAPTACCRESMQFGDWLDPDAPPDRPWDAKADADYLANAFYAYSARLSRTTARILGVPERRRAYERSADGVARDLGEVGRSRGRPRRPAAPWRYGSGSRRTRARRSSRRWRARSRGGRPGRERIPRHAAGAAGPGRRRPLRGGVPDAAATEPLVALPGGQGATTVWERWDAIRPDGSIHPMDAWRRTLAVDGRREPDALVQPLRLWRGDRLGVPARRRPRARRHGSRTIRFAPRPVAGLERAAAEVETPYGRAAIAWALEGAGLRVELDLPLGTTGQLDLPLGAQSRVTVDDGPLDAAPLGPGHHEILVIEPSIARPAPPNRNPPAVAALSARR